MMMSPSSSSPSSARQWWRRAAASLKDKRSLYAARFGLGLSSRRHHHPELESAVILATTHDDRSLDYKAASRVFASARAAPSSLLLPLLRLLSRRASRTHSWPVALKSLLLSHGLLLLSSSSSSPSRLPFDLSDFRDPSHPSFSSFVRSYFLFLDHRSILLHPHHDNHHQALADLDRIDRLQTLLDLLIQIRPCSDDMAVGLILEAMDCILIEIFEVYSGICNGIAGFLVGFLHSSSDKHLRRGEDEKRRGLLGIRILRRAGEQSSQLSSYFDVCRQLGVLNAAEIPAVERIPDEDVDDLERLVLGGVTGNNKTLKDEHHPIIEKVIGVDRKERKSGNVSLPAPEKATVVTEEWVVFDEEGHSGKSRNEGCSVNEGYFGNPFLDGCNGPWASNMHLGPNNVTTPQGDLIQLI